MIRWFSVFNEPNYFGTGDKKFWMLEPELDTKTLDSDSQSLKLAFRLNSPTDHELSGSEASKFGLGQFGDCTFRRWWSQMFYTIKVRFLKTWMVRLQRMFAWKVFLLSSWGPGASMVSLPLGIWKNLVRPWPREGNMACDVFLLAWGVVSLHKS